MCVYTWAATSLNEIKGGGRDKIHKGGLPTCLKSTGDKIGIPDG